MKLRLLIIGVLFALKSYGAGEWTQLTHAGSGHQIHNRQCFSPDGRFIYYDSRNDETQLALSRAIGRVEIATGREEILHRTEFKGIGAVTCHPREARLAFILGLPGQPYAPHLRGGATLAPDGSMQRLDARDVTPPFTTGALRGGTHAFHWSPGGTMLSFTYNDALVPIRSAPNDLRSVGILIPGQPVTVDIPSPGVDFSGTAAAAMIVPVAPSPRPGSDEILRAFDEDWLDERTLAFQGIVLDGDGAPITELFLAELPENPRREIPETFGPSEAMPTTLGGTIIRRLTRSSGQPHPGIQGPRHWVRASPDGKSIAFLARDVAGIVQIHSVSRSGGVPAPLSRLKHSVQDVFDWSPDGKHLACIADGRIQLINATTGIPTALTPPSAPEHAPRYAAVFSPDGSVIATNRPTPHPDGGVFLQIHLVKRIP